MTDTSRTIGPVADKVREQHQKTSDELSNLYASRQTPNNPTATGQPLTHYHSFFSELLSWNNPRTYHSPPELPAHAGCARNTRDRWFRH